MTKYLLDVDEVHAQLDSKRKAEGLSWRGLARILDLTPSTLTRLRAGNRPDADALVTMLVWLDIDLAYVVKPEVTDG
jgi:transcriptional regulator with XRE-family HTH domain